ncbi:LacI family DNA-binding transcriptional regulator [Lederbergia wuyishanensis]|uniref:LacI family transcriptional regulator n=1 Tax=Lederbergia wuyishanensis TaxID=1347903 RepID=A0ABU0D673_9BACI|nr:LacI family DNA-binding transcriptional regulator [Lederbergia wuyishanensis]MCJ8008682.1 LacI family transcriptional regulator [Lederbergia wuyishanensis]MDQ0343899.1 LacI family transcriptional regulator [Lederbergia wuyishanensis]
MASIKDVAKLAGVSVATVSRVLNNKGYVGVDTREKVENAIQTLNYKPNEVARSLFKKQSKTIGLLLPSIMNPFFPELSRAVEDVAADLGYNVILCNTDGNKEKEQRYLDMLLQKYVDGIIFTTTSLDPDMLQQLQIPIVCMDRKVSTNITTVVVNNKKGAQLATQFLLDKGCKRVAHIRGPENVYTAKERLEGYLDIVKNKEWFKESYIVNGQYGMEKAIEATLELLQTNPEIDGIFAANDTTAIGAMKAAHQIGLRIPEDISIIGFDGIALSKSTIPELTTVAQPIYEIGKKAASLLVQLIDGNSIQQNLFTLDVKLIERHST